MRIGVAGQAARGLEMKLFLIIMALAANRDIVLRCGTVAAVAVLTGNGLVTPAFFIYLGRLCSMALYAIA